MNPELHAILFMFVGLGVFLTLAAFAALVSRNHPAPIDVALGESGDEG